MSPERLAQLKENAPNYDDYSAREDVAELVEALTNETEGLYQTISYLSGEVTSAREELLSVRDFADRLKARREEAVEEFEKVKAQLDVVVALVYAMGSMELIQHVAPIAYPDE